MCGSGQSKVKNPERIGKNSSALEANINQVDPLENYQGEPKISNISLKPENIKEEEEDPRLRKPDMAMLERHRNPRKDDVGPIRAPDFDDNLDPFIRRMRENTEYREQIDNMSN